MTNELDRLVQYVKQVDREENLAVQTQILSHRFRIPSHVSVTQLMAHLLMLAETTDEMGMREPHTLDALVTADEDSPFYLDGRLCYLRYHHLMSSGTIPPSGFLEFSHADEYGLLYSINYDDAWSLMTDGRIVLYGT